MAQSRSAAFAGTPDTFGGFRDVRTEADLHGLRVSAANGFAVTPAGPGEFRCQPVPSRSGWSTQLDGTAHVSPSVLGALWQVVQRLTPGRLRRTISCVRHVGCRDCEDFASVMSNVRLTVIGADLHACGNFAKVPTDAVCLQ